MESIHPSTVHFPLALLSAAFLLEALALVLRRPVLHTVSLWNLGLGTAGAAAAVWTGRAAMAAAKHSMEIHEIMSLHERLGYGVLIMASAILAWRLIARDALRPQARWAALLLLGLACSVMGLGAHLGGRMVYEFGVGGSYGRSSGIEVVGHEH